MSYISVSKNTAKLPQIISGFTFHPFTKFDQVSIFSSIKAKLNQILYRSDVFIVVLSNDLPKIVKNYRVRSHCVYLIHFIMRLMQNGLIQLQSNILAIDSIDGVISFVHLNNKNVYQNI